MLREQVLLQRAQQYLTEALSAAQIGLNSDDLADGQPVLDRHLTITGISSYFRQNIPEMLKDHLTLTHVRVGWHEIPYDPQHWMGSDQPTRLPVVSVEAIFTTDRDLQIPLQASVELLLD